MSQITCSVITDLLELYADKVVSEDTEKLVEAHLCNCVNCMDKLETIKQNLSIPAETDTKPMKRIKSKIKKKNIIISLVSVFVVATVLLLAFSFITTSSLAAIPYERTHIYNVEQGENDWEIIVSFIDNIDSYWMMSRLLDETTMEYYFFFSDSYFTRYFSNRVAINSSISIPAYERQRLPLYYGEFLSPDAYEPGMEVTLGEEAVEIETVRIYYCTYAKFPNLGNWDFSERYLIWEKHADETR